MGVQPVTGLAKQKQHTGPADVGVKQVKKHYNHPPALIEDLLNLPPGGAALRPEPLVEDTPQRRAIALTRPTEPRSFILAANPGTFSTAGIALGRLRAYILNTARVGTDPDFVEFLNLQTRTYDARLDISGDLSAFVEPQTMEITNDGGTLVVAVRGSDPRNDPRPPVSSHLTLVNTRTASRVRRINLPDRHWPAGLALSPDGRTAYVSTQARSADLQNVVGFPVLVVDLSSGSVIGRVELPFGGSGSPGEIVITPDGALLFVLSARQFTSATSNPGVYAIDTRTLTIIAAIGGTNTDASVRRAVRTASQLAMHPSGSKVFVSPTLIEGTFDQFGFGVIDTATATLAANIPVPNMRQDSELSDLSVTSDGQVLIVYDNLSGHLDYFDAVSHQLLVQEPVDARANRGALSKGP
jgi:DNA-binding beta-propeller fold protein YncE